ncbi:L,D-transpeptidase [Stieleria sp. JC731]|uniref:L,D-transpeptidase n=1 Tax=Pirellulaceae TaxID=2691357 RepID=UPI001E5EDA41|nr:L,D-transpeptidase [Stieleria sp. JC731]
MQTIKTAAIVVLMLTVLYGGYVSMTTPPEPLSEDIADYLVIDEAGGGNLTAEPIIPGVMITEDPNASLSLGEPPAGLLDEMSGHQHHIEAGMSHSNSPSSTATAMLTPPSSSAMGMPGTAFADVTPKPNGEAEKSNAPRALPAVDLSAPTVTPGPIDSYASTSSQFQLPDPATANSNFDPSKGQPFDGGESMSLNSASPNLTDQGNNGSENLGLINAISAADELYGKGQLKEALATLSVFCGMPGTNDVQQEQLMSRLDFLAREVIYSKRHLLEKPHKLSGNESLVELAKEYKVPWQLITNINGIEDPIAVLPGTELKMVRGPFRAEVDLTGKVMTMFLGDLYAGQFEIEVGKEPAPEVGTFTVQDKQTSRTFYGPNGQTIDAGQPSNPYGTAWLDLGGQLCIHGSPNTVKPTDKGCISVAGDYAKDVYGILSQGSTVTIRR